MKINPAVTMGRIDETCHAKWLSLKKDDDMILNRDKTVDVLLPIFGCRSTRLMH